MTNDIQSQVARVSQYGHPNVYANNEKIEPPMKKEKIRVVEPSAQSGLDYKQQKLLKRNQK